MKGKNSREFAGEARVFLGKNTRKTGVYFAFNGLPLLVRSPPPGNGIIASIWRAT